MSQDSDQGAVSLDVLVVGSGVAGLFAALGLSRVEGLRAGVLTKGELSQSATRWAQGGIAAVLPGDEDSTDLHIADTLAAGHDLCDLDAVRVLVEEGPDAIVKLIGAGMMFDRDTIGNYLRAREGGHSTARVLHAGGVATGAEVERALVEAVRDSDLAIMEGWFSLDLIIEDGRCKGVHCVDVSGNQREVRAGVVLLATGGAGQLYSVTTNPLEATGDGVAMALRAGVPVADLEFFQFHPTALYYPGIPRPLLSEALRGHGAVLRDRDGNRWVDELLPRDQVSRAMAHKMIEQGVSHLWLDATQLLDFAIRFPTIAEALSVARLDPATDWLPVAPAAHYISGGLLTDLDGATACAGLFAAGEVACTGVHGANRLASNSLLEGLVYGLRAARAIVAGKDRAEATGAMRGWMGMPSKVGCKVIAALEDEQAELLGIDIPVPDMSMYGSVHRRGAYGADADTAVGAGAGIGQEGLKSNDIAKVRSHFQDVMTRGAGVLRSAESLKEVARVIGDALRESACAGYGTEVDSNPGPAAPSAPSGPSVTAAKPMLHVDRSDGSYSDGDRAGTGRSGQAQMIGRDHAAIRDRAELCNLCTVAGALVRSAFYRKETRGAHARVEYPFAADSGIVRIVHGERV
ncbi:MAG: FAD-binding protein [Actinobacteria bacterium]|jgi:L-aspartate oxidase|nr:FAD-binding protein [Actinomycetota bacterium]